MSEEATASEGALKFTPDTSVSDQQAQLWERITSPTEPEAAITPEAVEGAVEADPAAKSDRDLVAPHLAALLNPQAPEEAPVVDQGEQPELTPEQLILQKLEAIEAREQRQRELEAQAQREAEIVAARTNMLANVEAEKDSLPGFYKLEQQDTLVQLVAAAAQSGQEVSEIDLAREIEAKARETWEKLNEVYANSTPSKEPAPAPATPEPTISTQLVSTESPKAVEEMSLEERKAYLWEQMTNRG